MRSEYNVNQFPRNNEFLFYNNCCFRVICSILIFFLQNLFNVSVESIGTPTHIHPHKHKSFYNTSLIQKESLQSRVPFTFSNFSIMYTRCRRKETSDIPNNLKPFEILRNAKTLAFFISRGKLLLRAFNFFYDQGRPRRGQC